MRVIFNIDKYNKIDVPVVIALGTFDGIHLGHQKLITRLKRLKSHTNCNSVIYTFREHPLLQLDPQKAPPLIMDLNEKIDGFSSLSIDYLVFNEFNQDFAQTSPHKFVENFLLRDYKINSIVVGYNFRFGYNGLGTVSMLQELGERMGFNVEVVPPVCIDGQIVSSSMIRRLIEDGNLGDVTNFLGRYYSITGEVIHGYGRGRKLGYPTANLRFNRKKVIPGYGVYLTRCSFEKNIYWGVTNVGLNPTFQLDDINIETHLLGYNGDLYNSHITVEFLQRIREERQYPNIDELRLQINSDIETAKNLIYKYREI